MTKIDLILENIRDDYMINLLEEGTASELETLKTKKFLNENLSRIRRMLIEEGALENIREHLSENWGHYLNNLEMVEEVAHENYPNIAKSNLKNKPARDNLAGAIKDTRKLGKAAKEIGNRSAANSYDNTARAKSQLADVSAKVSDTKEAAAIGKEKTGGLSRNNPRFIKSTK